MDRMSAIAWWVWKSRCLTNGRMPGIWDLQMIHEVITRWIQWIIIFQHNFSCYQIYKSFNLNHPFWLNFYIGCCFFQILMEEHSVPRHMINFLWDLGLCNSNLRYCKIFFGLQKDILDILHSFMATMGHIFHGLIIYIPLYPCVSQNWKGQAFASYLRSFFEVVRDFMREFQRLGLVATNPGWPHLEKNDGMDREQPKTGSIIRGFVVICPDPWGMGRSLLLWLY